MFGNFLGHTGAESPDGVSRSHISPDTRHIHNTYHNIDKSLLLSDRFNPDNLWERNQRFINIISSNSFRIVGQVLHS